MGLSYLCGDIFNIHTDGLGNYLMEIDMSQISYVKTKEDNTDLTRHWHTNLVIIAGRVSSMSVSPRMPIFD